LNGLIPLPAPPIPKESDARVNNVPLGLVAPVFPFIYIYCVPLPGGVVISYIATFIATLPRVKGLLTLLLKKSIVKKPPSVKEPRYREVPFGGLLRMSTDDITKFRLRLISSLFIKKKVNDFSITLNPNPVLATLFPGNSNLSSALPEKITLPVAGILPGVLGGIYSVVILAEPELATLGVFG